MPMGNGRKNGIERKHVSEIEDSIKVSCDYCHKSIRKKIERIKAHLKDCQKKKYLEQKVKRMF